MKKDQKSCLYGCVFFFWLVMSAIGGCILRGG